MRSTVGGPWRTTSLMSRMMRRVFPAAFVVALVGVVALLVTAARSYVRLQAADQAVVSAAERVAAAGARHPSPGDDKDGARRVEAAQAQLEDATRTYNTIRRSYPTNVFAEDSLSAELVAMLEGYLIAGPTTGIRKPPRASRGARRARVL